MADFRVDVGFFRHIKTKRLKRMLGLEGVVMLQMLWAYATENKHDGDTVYTQDDIDLAVDSEFEPGKFATILCDIGFLDSVDGGFVLHQWEDHNGFAATASARVEKARKAANARWENKNGQSHQECEVEHQADANGCSEHMLNDACSNAPSPSPSPSPKESSPKTKFSPPSLDEVTEYCEQRGNGVDPVKWHAFYAAKNWMIGKNKMANWKQAVITWESRSRDNPKNETIPCPACQFSDSPICAKKPNEKRIACPSFREKAA